MSDWQAPRTMRPYRNFLLAVASLVADDNYLGMTETQFVGAALKASGGGLNPKEIADAYKHLIAESGIKVSST